jgi:hypothetical protein
MAEALHLPANELVAKGTTGRDRVRDMHDADRNAAQMIDAVARGPAMSLILDNMEATAEPVDAIAQYPNEMGKAAVDIKARCKPGVGRGNA